MVDERRRNGRKGGGGRRKDYGKYFDSELSREFEKGERVPRIMKTNDSVNSFLALSYCLVFLLKVQ